MSKTPNKKMIGLFTLTGLVVFFGAMLIFLGDKIFVNDDDLVVLYFDESIKGLSIGAPVALQGVEVGKVIKTDLVTNMDNLTFKIPVYVKLNHAQNVSIGSNKVKAKDRDKFLGDLVEKGLRGRLITQNLLTGQLMIELVFLSDTEMTYKGDGKYVEIPTALSPMGELSKGLQDLPIRQSIEKFNLVLEQTSSLVSNINQSLSRGKGDRAGMMDNINKTVRDIGEAAIALRNFADYIERHPEALIKGKGGY